jgi:hypothetical protein
MHISAIALTCFIAGLALHVLAQVDAIARAKNNAASSRIGIIQDRAIPIIVRSAICAAVFILWLQGQLAGTLIATGIAIPDWAGKVLDLHVGGGIAFLAGYCFDSGLAFIPVFKSYVPPPIDQPSDK